MALWPYSKKFAFRPHASSQFLPALQMFVQQLIHRLQGEGGCFGLKDGTEVERKLEEATHKFLKVCHLYHPHLRILDWQY